MRRILIGLSILASLSACGGSADSPLASLAQQAASAPACDAMYADGADSTNLDNDHPCIDGAGQTQYALIGVHSCVDGTTLSWNDFGWWTSTEHTVHAHPAGGEKVAPVAERDACSGETTPT
jgi:hypothetical protein